ncbi:MAG: hypothetical protein OXC26_22255 [Albidovulum sp.]|nr:hypothetical protein [Albidovulum sp.]
MLGRRRLDLATEESISVAGIAARARSVAGAVRILVGAYVGAAAFAAIDIGPKRVANRRETAVRAKAAQWRGART